MERLGLEFDDVDALRRAYEHDLQHGRAFVPEPALELEQGARCTVVLTHPDGELAVTGTVAAIRDDPRGVEVALDDPAKIAAFVSPPGGPSRRVSVNERIRTLPIAEQQKLARNGELQERVALERLFGKNVWEALLHNPRLTVPEVARIARKRTVPRPLLELIVDNAAWIKTGPVRRALLSNSRLGTDSVMRILRLAPKNELKLAEKQTAYPVTVREAARKLLRR